MGQASRKRHQEKLFAKSVKKAAKTAAKGTTSTTMSPTPLAMPVITEDDLLAFQYSHFGDDTKPDNWFVDVETALNMHSEIQEEDAPKLGHYEDGSKRTLTDEQIAMFRHSEIQELLRERRLKREEEDYQQREPETYEDDQSDNSSLEGDLVGLAKPAPKPKPKRQPPPKRQPSQSSLSEFSRSTGRSGAARRKRKKEVPYDQRHKRKWEDYIEDNDPLEGSMTHRRLVRELDGKQEEKVDMDY